MTQCPSCGGSTGYYINVRVSGWIMNNFTFEGAHDDNTEMWSDRRLQFKDSSVAHCQECHENLGPVFKLHTSERERNE